ncbi:hypothetical protein HGA01_05075 [Gordonia amicalis]|nr:hypothetical protein CNO18_01355 [Gordonia sp. 1D]MBA5847597.1 hypothetical protein [Gordonia amicalis]NKX76999.1 hypothetical protein [Gordonia amicalis]GAC52197.1 hypothetical protein GOAMI_07_02020 [Gordonia amicalis NBRC 100051 = JCM 11271]
MRAGWVAVVLAAVLCGGGCSAVDEATFGPSDDVSAARVAELNGQLRGLPSLEATLDDFRAMREAIVEQVEVIAPGVRFESTNPPDNLFPDYRNPCSGEWLETDGRTVQLDRRTSPVPISEEQWPRAVEIVRSAAAAAGLTNETWTRNQPGDREVRFSDDENGSVKFGTFEAALLSIRTPCRLPAGPAEAVTPPAADGSNASSPG